MYSQTEMLAVIRGILLAADVDVLHTFEYQLPNDLVNSGVIAMWISPDRRSFNNIRKALNEANLWVASTNYREKLETGTVIEALIVNDRRKNPR